LNIALIPLPEAKPVKTRVSNEGRDDLVEDILFNDDEVKPAFL
jgi:hypothetical protein